MVILALVALIAGVFCGLLDFGSSVTDVLVQNRDLILYLLMFFVGISIGMHKGMIKKIREYHIRILIIPAGIVIGSIAGGIVCAWITGIPLNESTAVACGLGWYSLSGITIQNKNSKKYTSSGVDGKYAIEAGTGDILIFSDPYSFCFRL